MNSADLAVIAKEWLRDYHAPPQWEHAPNAKASEPAPELPKRHN